MWNEILKILRTKNDLTQSDVAKLLGISQATYGRYEIGDVEPNITSILTLADYYKVSTDYLLGRIKYSIKSNSEIKMMLAKIQNDIEEIKKVL